MSEYLVQWRAKVVDAARSFLELYREQQELDFEYGILFGALVVPLHDDVVAFDLNAIMSLQNLVPENAQPILDVLRNLPDDRTQAVRYLAEQAQSDEALRGALPTLVAQFTEQLATSGLLMEAQQAESARANAPGTTIIIGGNHYYAGGAVPVTDETVTADGALPARPKLFISYARSDDDAQSDGSFVLRLYDDLTAAGYDVWLDQHNMPGRQLTFLDEIKRAIYKRDQVLLIWGPGARDSKYVMEEWQYALSQCKGVTTLLFQGAYDDLPDDLKHYHAPDFTQASQYDDTLKELLRQLREPLSPLGDVNAPNLLAHQIKRPQVLAAVKQPVLRHLREPLQDLVYRICLHGMG